MNCDYCEKQINGFDAALLMFSAMPNGVLPSSVNFAIFATHKACSREFKFEYREKTVFNEIINAVKII